ncbi:MAG: hypothetical protein ACNI27_11075 [Desulfovibrio sp.]
MGEKYSERDQILLSFESELRSNSEKEANKRIMTESVLQAGSNATRALLLISGGTGVALLAYIAQVNASSRTVPCGIWASFYWLGLSVVFALLQSGVTYLTQHYYSEHAYENWKEGSANKTKADRLNKAAIGLWIVSFLFLVIGGVLSIRGLS